MYIHLVPPLAVAVAVPVFPPLHNTSVESAVTLGPPMSFNDALAVSLHPFASVTINEYVPAARC